MTRNTSHHGLRQRLHHFADRDFDELGRVIWHQPVHPLRKNFASSVILALTALAVCSALAEGARRMAMAEAVLPVDARGDGIILRSEFDPRHVLDAHAGAVRLARTMMLPNSSGVDKRLLVTITAFSVARRCGQLPEFAGSELGVLRAHGLGDIAGRQVITLEFFGLSHSRIEYSVPNNIASPTPGTRRIFSSRLAAA